MPRSDPITIDRHGEVILLAIQKPPEIRLPWRLLVTDHNSGRQKSMLFAYYSEAKTRAGRILGALEDSPDSRLDVTIVSRSVGYGPPYKKISDLQLLTLNQRKKYWCPYCRKIRQLLWLPKLQARGCIYCGITERDFHMRRCNPKFWSPAARYRITHEGEYL